MARRDRPSDEDVVPVQAFHLGVVVAVTSVTGLLLLVVMGNTPLGAAMSLAYPVALLGSAGGTANTYRRLRKLQSTPLEVREHVPRTLAVTQVYVSPVVGAVFALVLYTLFLAGLLQGELFPTFTCSADRFTDFGGFATCGPATNADVATAFVWAFVAGFAEQLVPTMLDRFLPGGAREV